MRVRNTVLKIALFVVLATPLVGVAQDTRLFDMVIEKAGIYRLSHTELLANGIDLGGNQVQHKRLAVEHNGEFLPILTKGQDSSAGRRAYFGPGSYIEFVVPEVTSTLYSNQAIYTVHYRPNQRHATFNRIRDLSDNAQGYSEYVYAQAKVAEQNEYSLISPNAEDPWAMAKLFAIGATPKQLDYQVDLPGYAPSQGNVELDVTVLGNSNFPESPDHHVQLLVNGQTVADEQFEGVVKHTISSQINASSLTGSGDQLSVKLVADLGLPFDFVMLEDYAFRYPRDLSAEDNAVSFSADDVIGANGQARIGGFLGARRDLHIYKADADGVERVVRYRKRYVDLDKTITEVRIPLEAGAKYFIAGKSGTDSGYLFPSALKDVVELSDIKNGDAQYLIIAHSNFIGDTLNQLVDIRDDKRSVKVVDVEQVYAQFGQGVMDADAIHEYIQFAANNLGTQMVLLVGADSYDYHGNQQDNAPALIPTLYRPTFTNMWVNFTSADATFGDLDGDHFPDIPVGRLPVRTEQQLADMIAKIVAFDGRTYDQTSVFVADKIDNGNQYSFDGDADAMIARLPSAWQQSGNLTKAYLEQDGGALARNKLLSAINAGTALTSYIGHTSSVQWSFSSPRLFHVSDVAGLTNHGAPTLVTQWGCWNAYYSNPKSHSVSQQLLLNGTNGAVATIGASTLTTALGEKTLAAHLYDAMFTSGVSIGDALITAKKAMAENTSLAQDDIQIGIQILGDPAIEMVSQ